MVINRNGINTRATTGYSQTLGPRPRVYVAESPPGSFALQVPSQSWREASPALQRRLLPCASWNLSTSSRDSALDHAQTLSKI